MSESETQARSIAGRLERIPPLPIHLRWAATVGIGVFLDGFTTLTVAAALTVLITTLHIDFARVGLLISASFGGMFVGAILFGAASERFGRRPIFIIAVALFGLLSILAAFAWDFSSLFWLRAIQGLGLGGAVPIAAALVAECLPARVRGRTFSLTYALLFALGYVLAPLAGLVCIRLFGPELGWRALFVLAGLALPFAFIAARILPESPRWLASKGRLEEASALLQTLEDKARAAGLALEAVSAPQSGGASHSSRLTEAFTGVYLHRTLLTWTLFFCIYFVQYGLNAWLPTLYVKVGGLAPQHALGLAVANGIVALGAAIIFGTTVDRLGRKTWFIAGFALSLFGTVCAIVALGLFHVGAWPVLFCAAVLLTAGTAVNAGSIYLYAPELFPTRMRSWATSTGSAASRVGSIVAPLAIGSILQTGLGLVSVFALLGAMCLIGLIAIVVAGIETKQRVLEELAT
jgi:putative MFS transporter